MSFLGKRVSLFGDVWGRFGDAAMDFLCLGGV